MYTNYFIHKAQFYLQLIVQKSIQPIERLYSAPYVRLMSECQQNNYTSVT